MGRKGKGKLKGKKIEVKNKSRILLIASKTPETLPTRQYYDK